MSPRSKRRIALTITLAFVGVLIAIATLLDTKSWRYSRHLDCDKQTDARANAICKSVERHLEYTCCGHAIFSPGYRSTRKTVTDVWCEQQIEQEDLAVLQALAKSNDWRLVSAADALLRSLTGYDQYGTKEPENSIFHKDHPSYLLKDGCSRN